MGKALRRTALILLLAAIVGALGYALWPKPVPVETAIVRRGPMRVTVDEDGRTRIKEKFVVSAPLAGRVARITLKEGDPVRADSTLVAAIDPSDPSLLDPRARAEAEARVQSAASAVERAGAETVRANSALELAQTEVKRLEDAATKGAGSPIELERARSTVAVRFEEARAAGFARDVASFDLQLAKSALVRADPKQDAPDGPGDPWRFEIRAPVDGRVLRVLQESAAVVAAGAPLIEIGNPADLELVVDVLSSDAVPIRPGAAATLEEWGGDAPLNGRVRLVEPAAFTKISALGVEEQRVNVIIDFIDPPEARAGLGDGYRVEARITVWDQPDVLKAPTGALFRAADSWAAFVISDGRVRQTPIQIGRRNGEEVEVLGGLEEGETLVVYPSDSVHDGVRAAPRKP
ncbi:MAG: HlyD family efflux transporter periplasmic adaptor subunit [Phycisphaerales bacterium]|nr:HlyD family efflux transporter periplasmic adaptor subunit [Phycisphaerales bacterium]